MEVHINSTDRLNPSSFSQMLCILSFSAWKSINHARIIQKIISTPINLMGNVIKKESIQEGAVWGFTHVTHSKPFRVVKLYLAMYITGHVHTRHSSVASGGRVSATHPKLGEGWAFRLSAVSPATRGQCRGRLCHWFPIWGRQCGRLQWTGGGCFTQAKGGPWTSEFDCCNIQDRKILCKANVSI